MRQQWEGVGLPWMLVVLGACGNAAKPGADAVSNDPLASCEALDAAKTEVDRAALEAQCASGLKQLEAVCP
jgi:hypothetical protein